MTEDNSCAILVELYNIMCKILKISINNHIVSLIVPQKRIVNKNI